MNGIGHKEERWWTDRHFGEAREGDLVDKRLTLRMEISSLEEVGMQRMWIDILVEACGNFLLIASIFSGK